MGAETPNGITIGGSVRVRNSAWGRLGLFGGGFGVNMDNGLNAGGNVMGNNYEMFGIDLAMRLDATFRNPIAEDLANMISDAIASTGLGGVLTQGLSSLLGGNDRSVNREALEDTKMLRDAVRQPA